jgi:hypothetical protein
MRNLIHMTHTLLMPVHVCLSYASCDQSPYVPTFHVGPTKLDTCIASKKKCSRLHLSVRLSSLWDPPQFLSQHNHLSSALKPIIYWRTWYIGLLDPYHQHVISTFNTCSRVSTPRSLTDTGRGYNLRGVSFPHHTPRPSQPTILHFPSKPLPRSQVNNLNISL